MTQLTLVAYILAPGFALNRWWLTLVYSIILLLVSSAEAVSRPPAAYQVFRFASKHHHELSSEQIMLLA